MGFITGTKILMYDGTIKNVEDIVVGDFLMGDDSTPREVLNTLTGKNNLYKIIPVKGDCYTITSSQYITLSMSRQPIIVWNGNHRNSYKVAWSSREGQIISKDFTVKIYGTKENAYNEAKKLLLILPRDKILLDLTLDEYNTKSKKWKSNWKWCRTGVNFSLAKDYELLIDPYYLGLWLGDGTSAKPNQITNIDQVVIDYIYEYAKILSLTVTNHDMAYNMSSLIRGKNNLYVIFRQYDLINNKHIPLCYKTASKDIRLKVLAGLIDTDGSLNKSHYEIIQKSNKLAEDIVYLAKSCGFAAYSKKCKKGCMYKEIYREGEYNRICISGHTNEVPTLIERKQADVRKQIKDVLHTGITIEPVGRGTFYKIKTNGRYLLSDFTIIR